MKDKYLIIFEECQLVEGFRQDIIYDIVRPHNTNIIPKSFGSFLKLSDTKTIEELYSIFSSNVDLVDEYIDFILKMEFGVISDFHLKSHLTKLNFNYRSNSYIENGIYILDNFDLNSTRKHIELLSQIGCISLEIRLVKTSKLILKQLFETIQTSGIESIFLKLNYFEELQWEDAVQLFELEPRIQSISVYNSNFEYKTKHLSFFNKQVDFNIDVGTIESYNDFIINQSFFIESKSRNPFLNKKIFIDEFGNIKNQLNIDSYSFGNLNKIDSPDQLISIVEKTEFQNYWKSPKDNIEICKNCEFRFMCMDTRIPLKKTNYESSWYHNTECNYNPFISKWSNEEGYLNLNQSGINTNLGNVIIDYDYLNSIIDEIRADE